MGKISWALKEAVARIQAPQAPDLQPVMAGLSGTRAEDMLAALCTVMMRRQPRYLDTPESHLLNHLADQLAAMHGYGHWQQFMDARAAKPPADVAG